MNVNEGIWQLLYKVTGPTFVDLTYALNTPTGVVLRHVTKEDGFAPSSSMVEVPGVQFALVDGVPSLVPMP